MNPVSTTETLRIDALDIVMMIDCFGDHRIVEVTLPDPVPLEALQRLTGVGQQTVLRNLPKPFFRIDCPGRFLLTGIVGTSKVRFTLRQAALENAREIVLSAVYELLALDPVTLEQQREG